ncbi:MAG: D-alanyl-D-alanine carboxypeptidase DacF precursor [Syntrophorhabdus sp. PtaB.Bin184]|jgi:D-alanyl-D-alanine carboxypeptidase (penicillin-binding protein 5/6)|nr:MAG: D-alanyl-D-alanine carboxypeptidase DacF precursor [Syntrophorhabdus sp. PtaB.Bin184]
MKRLLVFVVVTLCIFGLTVDAAARGAAGKKTPPARQGKEAEPPCKSFIVIEAQGGKMIDGSNIDERRAPASITKLMVAYVVMGRLATGGIKLTDKVAISKEASKIGGSQVYLKEGEVFTLEDLMKAMMVASGNDAAYAISEFVAGSKDEMVNLMNAQAKALGLANTEFHTVHGLPPAKGEKEDLTSCNDLAVLARELLKSPKILEWTSIQNDTFRDGKFVLTNTNKLLGKFAGADGLKTGYYSQTGFNIVATAKRGDMRFIAVVMGSPSGKIRDSFAMEKLQKAFARYKMVNVVKKGEVIDQDVFLVDGKYRKMKGVTEKSFLYPMEVEKKGAITREILLPERIKGEIKEGQRLGELVLKLSGQVIGKVNIVSPVYVPKANLFTRFIRRLGLNI